MCLESLPVSQGHGRRRATQCSDEGFRLQAVCGGVGVLTGVSWETAMRSYGASQGSGPDVLARLGWVGL